MKTEAKVRRKLQRLGLPAGPVLAASVYLLLPATYLDPDGASVAFSPAGRATAAVAVWMAVWWLTEAIEVYATALLPLLLLPILGARSMKATAAPYAHELIFLFMGGFLLALAMERWGLHRRIALVALRLVGNRPSHMVAGFMAVTAGLSMWVSNTATTIMMLPVATSVIDLVEGAREPSSRSQHSFALALLLGVAYAASIGGLATPIGTPPNLFLISYARSELGIEISFVRWMAFALPLVALLLPVTWLLLTRILFVPELDRIEGGARMIRRSLAALGPMRPAERRVFAVFVAASALWILRPLLVELECFGMRPAAGLTDAGVAMLAALSLFVMPTSSETQRFVLDWETARNLPWGILVLFGGGLSLAAAINANGVGELLAARVAAFAGIAPLLLLVGIVTLVVFLTELTSNTATSATLIPILAGLAPGLGVDPLLLIVPAALSASCAFMLPVATPPNAIIFGSGLVTIPQMIRAGFWLNWICVGAIVAYGYLFVLPRLG